MERENIGERLVEHFTLITYQYLVSSGVVLLDAAEYDIPSISERLLQEFARRGQVLGDEADTLHRILLMKHQ